MVELINKFLREVLQRNCLLIRSPKKNTSTSTAVLTVTLLNASSIKIPGGDMNGIIISRLTSVF